MKRFLGRMRAPFIYLLLVGLLGWGAFLAPLNMRSNVESYFPLDLEIEPVSALVGSSQQKPGVTKPQSGRVVLIVVSGLGRDDLEGLPALKNLKDAERGTDVSAGAYLFTPAIPSAVPALVTLLSGASSEIAGGYTLDPPTISPTAPTPAEQLARLDNIFTAAKRNNFTTAAFGSETWVAAFNPNWLDFFTVFPDLQPANDVTDAALNFLKKKSANFTLIHLSAMGTAQAQFGYNAPEVLDTRISLNTALSRLTNDSQIDLSRTTVIITGDWDNSLRAGERWTVPLVMLGQAVQPGEKSWGRQEDVAPTVAALLGIEIPRHNQGRILTNALSIPVTDSAEKLLALVEQRQALARSYRARLGLPLPIAINDALALEADKSVQVAIQDYRLGLYDGIEALTDPVLRYTRQDMQQARLEWYAQSSTPRAVLVIVLLLLPLAVLFIRRNGLAWLGFLGAGLAVGLTYVFYWTQGRQFSFNTVTLDGLRDSSLWRTGFAILATLLLIVPVFDWLEKRYQNRLQVSGRVHLQHAVFTGLRKPPFPFARLMITCFFLLAWLVYFSAFIWVGWYYWRFGFVAPFIPTNTPVSVDFAATFQLFLAFDNLLGFMAWMVLAPLFLALTLGIKRKLLGGGEREEDEDILTEAQRLKRQQAHPATE
jgi:hypothetical protein